ncbi:UPF0307 protein YjgA [hydrothermal vent metagenome]|uniref:UPF0307 protein YjgA n=1 Tax=hydrothermal vent metagenome TaxID=652676 RepID=A0A3B1BQP9_9ZZZZ
MTDTEREKSKSQVKREMQALRDLGKELIALSGASLGKMPISDTLRTAVLSAKGFKREALRRQIQHIGVLMREEDIAAISRMLESLKQPHRADVQVLHEVEHWRDALVGGNKKLLEELAARFDGLDFQHVRQLIRNARKEQEREQPPKSARALFRYLSELRWLQDV